MICCREDVGCARLLKNNRACLFFHEMHGSIGLQQKGWLKMEVLQKISILEARLRRLETSDRYNYGVCRKIERKIQALRKSLQE